MTGTQIVDRIDELLKNKGYKRQTLTLELNVPPQTISNWKKRGSIPPADVLYRIAQFLGVSSEFLLTGKDSSGLPIDTLELARLIERLSPDDRDEITAIAKMKLERSKKDAPFTDSIS